jgi:hypothetical protein
MHGGVTRRNTWVCLPEVQVSPLLVSPSPLAGERAIDLCLSLPRGRCWQRKCERWPGVYS